MLYCTHLWTGVLLFWLSRVSQCLAAAVHPDDTYISNHILNKLLTPSYDRLEWPQPKSGPLVVNVSIYTMSISSISEIGMDLKLDIFLRQIWHDERLSYVKNSSHEYIMVHADRTGEIWVPDTFIRNEKENYEHSVTVPNKIMRIFPEGKIFYSQRIGLKLACDMDLRLFPFDNQTCYVQLESLAHDSKYITYRWSEPAWETKQKSMPEFDFMGDPVVEASCDGEYTTGKFSCVEIRFTLKREFGYYIIQTYIPTILIVILSWVSFWLDVSAVPARISVGLLTVLNLTTISSGLNDNLPKVSYIKAIDVWMFGSQVFVFGAMLEFAIANVVDRRIEARNKRISRQKTAVQEHMASNGIANAAFEIPNFDSHLNTEIYFEETLNAFKPSTEKKKTTPKQRTHNTAYMMDRVCKYAFPICYSIFFVVYWIYYLYKSGELVFFIS